jgi:hypothetical protein
MADATNTTSTKGQETKGQMLPGLAGICMFLMFMTMLNVYGALIGVFGPGINKYGILTFCSILGAGLFGLLRLKKWGWAIVTAGCLLLSVGFFFYFSKLHQFGALIQAIFVLVFFLYLVRPETRERLL